MASKSSNQVKPIPEGFHTVTPYFLVNDTDGYKSFLESALGAKEVECMSTPDGKIVHASMEIGDSRIMFGDPMGNPPTRTMIYLYVNDVDSDYERAIGAGAKSVRPPNDEFYGDRSCCVEDPEGNYWCISRHVEDVTREETARRFGEMMKKAPSADNPHLSEN